MAFSINRAILFGNLTRDPELKYTKSGKPVLTLNMATNHSYKGADGNYQDVPTFHRIVVWGKIAEWLANNLRKGMKVYVDGRIQTREYQDKAGNTQRSREIVADNVIPGERTENIKSSRQDEGQVEEGSEQQEMNEDIDPDDIPF